jgi:predicted Zn finger-like uncharacterized protein
MVMTVECPECRTSFPVDPGKVPSSGVRAQCSVCPGIFPVFPFETDADAWKGHGAEPGLTEPGLSEPGLTEPGLSEPELPEPDPSRWEPAEAAEVVEVPEASELAEVVEAVEFEEAAEVVEVVEAAEVVEVVEAAEVVEVVEATEVIEAEPPEVVEPLKVVEPAIPEPAIPEPTAPEPRAPEPTAPEAPAAPAPGPIQFGKRDPQEKARRLARVLVSDMIVYHREKHSQALEAGTLVEEFQDEVQKSWEEYVDQIGSELAEGTPYFREALNEILAKGQEMF